MTKPSFQVLLLITAITSMANSILGFFLLELPALAVVVMSIVLMANAKKAFGDAGKPAYLSSLWNMIATGAVLVFGGGLFLLISLLTFGAGLLGYPIFHLFVIPINIGFGIWQIIAWNSLRKMDAASMVSV